MNDPLLIVIVICLFGPATLILCLGAIGLIGRGTAVAMVWVSEKIKPDLFFRCTKALLHEKPIMLKKLSEDIRTHTDPISADIAVELMSTGIGTALMLTLLWDMCLVIPVLVKSNWESKKAGIPSKP